jgi:hypothetical protein
MEPEIIVSGDPLIQKFMGRFKDKINKWGVFWGIIYGLVALGFYSTPVMLFILGLASSATAIALQNILFYEYRWHFIILGLLLAFITILIYMRAKGFKKLTIADITQSHFFIGTLTIVFIFLYLILFWLVTFFFPPK